MQKTRLFLAFVFLAAATSMSAETITNDPLHGCSVSSGCTDNGTNTPITDTSQFGFTISPGPQTGTLFLDILVPNNLAGGPFSITGTASGTATLVGAWTSGDLSAILGFAGASPANPIGAYLPSTQALDAGDTGFKVFQANMGTLTLNANPGFLTGPIFSTSGVASGSYIVGFLHTSDGYIGVANSGALLVTGTPTPEPEVAGMVGMGLGLLAFARMKLNRKK